jgi:hypothetical protein
MFERKFYGRDLVVGVKNLEIAGQSEALGFASQQPCGKRVKCANPWIVERLGLANQQIADALLHLRRRFVGEGYSENRAAGHALLDEVRDPVSNRPRLARAGTGEYQDWTLKGDGGFLLPGIQFV